MSVLLVCITASAQRNPIQHFVNEMDRTSARIDRTTNNIRRTLHIEAPRSYVRDYNTLIRHKSFKKNTNMDIIATNFRVIVHNTTVDVYSTEGLVASFSRFDFDTFEFNGVICGPYSNCVVKITNTRTNTYVRFFYGDNYMKRYDVQQVPRPKRKYGLDHRSTYRYRPY